MGDHKNTEVLLVDDDEMTLFIHQKILDRCSLNHPHRSFLSGEECYRYIMDNKDDGQKYIILLDINMPSMSGWGLLNELEDNGITPDQVIVVMATSSVDYEDRVKASEYKLVVDFFEKPMTLSSCESLSSLPEIATF